MDISSWRWGEKIQQTHENKGLIKCEEKTIFSEHMTNKEATEIR